MENDEQIIIEYKYPTSINIDKIEPIMPNNAESNIQIEFPNSSIFPTNYINSYSMPNSLNESITISYVETDNTQNIWTVLPTTISTNIYTSISESTITLPHTLENCMHALFWYFQYNNLQNAIFELNILKEICIEKNNEEEFVDTLLNMAEDY